MLYKSRITSFLDRDDLTNGMKELKKNLKRASYKVGGAIKSISPEHEILLGYGMVGSAALTSVVIYFTHPIFYKQLIDKASEVSPVLGASIPFLPVAASAFI